MRDQPHFSGVQVPLIELVVESAEHADEITERIGVTPTATRRYPNALVDRELTEWTLDLGSDPVIYEAVHSAGDRLAALGNDVADKIATLIDDTSGRATLSIVQYFGSDWRTKGIEIPPTIIAWLARAGASLAIDQYLSDDP